MTADAGLRAALAAMELEKDDGYGGEWGQGKTAGVEACIDILHAALVAPTEPTLDAAWAEAEAALPEVAVLSVIGPTLTEGRRWVVAATVYHDQTSTVLAQTWDDEIAAALRALAARLASEAQS